MMIISFTQGLTLMAAALMDIAAFVFPFVAGFAACTDWFTNHNRKRAVVLSLAAIAVAIRVFYVVSGRQLGFSELLLSCYAH